jgi:hypothetical protein
MLLDYGAMGLVGNALLSRHIERVGASRAVFMALMCIATGMLLTPWTNHWTNHWIAMGLALLPWGLGVFASNSALQARLVNQAPLAGLGVSRLEHFGHLRRAGAGCNYWRCHDRSSNFDLAATFQPDGHADGPGSECTGHTLCPASSAFAPRLSAESGAIIPHYVPVTALGTSK